MELKQSTSWKCIGINRTHHAWECKWETQETQINNINPLWEYTEQNPWWEYRIRQNS